MNSISKFLNNRLPSEFYKRDTLLIARELLGKVLVYNSSAGLIAGMIVETEAYVGEIDESAHSFNGKTLRNEVMFREGGYFYVYFTYGMHFCCNVVTGHKDEGNAVLIRAVEPINGLEIIKNNRGNNHKLFNLTNGPAKLTQAFAFNRGHNGISLLSDDIFLTYYKNISAENISVSTRIGIKKSVNFPWRFYITDNNFVSKK